MNYFEMNENKDYQLLLDFNQHTNLFDTVRRAKEGHHTDAIASHINNLGEERLFNIEIKRRFCNHTKYDTAFIEDYKMASMLLDYHFFGIEPLYINFYNDAVVIFNLTKLSKYPKQDIWNIYSEGKKVNQTQERRYGLDFKDAVVFIDYKIQKQMGDGLQVAS